MDETYFGLLNIELIFVLKKISMMLVRVKKERFSHGGQAYRKVSIGSNKFIANSRSRNRNETLEGGEDLVVRSVVWNLIGLILNHRNQISSRWLMCTLTV